MAFDGVPIANDGTVPFRNRERITFDHLVSMKKPDETAQNKNFEGWRGAGNQSHSQTCK
ncbi:DegP protease 10 [Euphorbia peplus]|nr:DegP protease 10 [Euphorbia peplus]